MLLKRCARQCYMQSSRPCSTPSSLPVNACMSPRPSLTIQTANMPNSPHPDLRLDVPTPSTPPTRNRARSSSPPRITPRGTPRPTSPDYRYATASPRLDGSPNPNLSHESTGLHGGLSGVGKAIGQRILRVVRRGNLPFMLVFVSYVPSPGFDRGHALIIGV